MLLLGLSGWVRRATEAVPMPIVMAMVAGVFLRFGIDLVLAFRDGFWIALPMTAACLALTAAAAPRAPAAAAHRRARRRRGGGLADWATFKPPADALFAFARPNLYVPAFSWAAMVELVVPLAITVLVVQNGQGIAILAANGHQPPINAITAGCGAGSIVTGAGRHGLDLPHRPGQRRDLQLGRKAAPLHRGDLRRRCSRSASACSRRSSRGCCSPRRRRSSPRSPGSRMLRVLQTAFTVSFSDRFTLRRAGAFLVTVADVPIFRIGAPFWGLVFGLAASWLLEREGLPKRSPC